jgi:hypothetical protein
MNTRQKLALSHHCRLACETMNPRFASLTPTHSIILSVNSGYE